MGTSKANTNTDYYLSPEYLFGDRKPPLKEFDVVGSLTLLKRYYRNRKDVWTCRCQCGNIKDIRGDNIRAGRTKSCGCLQHATNTARRKQTSAYRVQHGQVKFRVYGYHSNGFRPGANRKLASVGFYTIEDANAAPGEYYISNCTAKPILTGQVHILMIRALNAMHGNAMIGPQGSLTIPQWADAYGVEFMIKLRSGQSHIRDKHAELEDAQDFAYKGIRL